MFKVKILISIFIFSSFLFGTSIIKNKTREIEKQIYKTSKNIYFNENTTLKKKIRSKKISRF